MQNNVIYLVPLMGLIGLIFMIWKARWVVAQDAPVTCIHLGESYDVRIGNPDGNPDVVALEGYSGGPRSRDVEATDDATVTHSQLRNIPVTREVTGIV